MTNAAGMSCLLEHKACVEHTDSIAMVDFNGMIQGVGGAIGTNDESSWHQGWSKTTGGRLFRYQAPFPISSEMLVSKVKSGKIVAIGSVDSAAIWEFDPTIAGYTAESWSEITSDFTPQIGSRRMAWGADIGDWFYIGGGWTGTDVYKTQNFTSWTLVGSLPAALVRISACAWCVHGGVIHLIGGATRLASPYGNDEYQNAERLGHHYTFDGTSFTLIGTDAAKFGSIWCDLASDGINLWFVGGYPPSSGRNKRYPYKSTDSGATWTQITEINDGMCWFSEAHRRGALSTSGAAYFIGGSYVNDVWKMA